MVAWCTPRPTRRQLLVGLAATAAAAGAGCDASRGRPGHAAGAGSSGTPSKVRDVRSFGAVGDGRTDDTAALNRAFAALRPGDTLTFPASHVFCHRDVLAVTADHVRLVGRATLSASAEATSAVRIDADDVRIESLSLTTPRTTRRWTTPDQHKLVLGRHAGIVVDAVHIDGSAAAGLFCAGPSQFRLLAVHVINTRADGIHMTDGTFDGAVTDAYVSHSGDDGIATVSYSADRQVCRNIVVTNPVLRNIGRGRGVSVVGGEQVTISHVDISGTGAAAVYIACESGDFTTRDVRNVTVRGGTVAGANTDATIDHGAVLVFCGRAGGSVADVAVSGLGVSGTRAAASRQIGAVVGGPTSSVSRVLFDTITLADLPTPYEGNAPLAGVRLRDVRADGVLVQASVTP